MRPERAWGIFIMVSAESIASIREKYHLLVGEMDERMRRLWAASEARALGYGGITAVAKATGLAVSTIRGGLYDLEQQAPEGLRPGPLRRRVRSPGGGRKPLTEKDPTLLQALESLVEPTARGDPMSSLRWSCKSTRTVAQELSQREHPISYGAVGDYLQELEYSLQGNRKTREGTSHPDRNAPFEHIDTQVQAFQKRGQPAISVDAKKKEWVGDFHNRGQEWRPVGEPERVRMHDFADPLLGKVVPYGVYDLRWNEGWVRVGTDHDTSEFAVQTIRQWWYQRGCPRYPQAHELLITADNGGSNGSRVRLWKVALQKLADETRLGISVCHLPPGTSKWNKIEHRLFCHITRNWRGRPLESHEVIVNLIGHTTTEQGLHIQAALDSACYPTGTKVSDQDLAQVRIERDSFHGDWNYSILPRHP